MVEVCVLLRRRNQLIDAELREAIHIKVPHTSHGAIAGEIRFLRVTNLLAV
jgi:hypothetical protein